MPLQERYRAKPDEQLYAKLRELVSQRQAKPAEFGDMDVAFNLLRDIYEDTFKHPDKIKSDREAVMQVLGDYGDVMKLPWRKGAIPPAYRTSAAGTPAMAYAAVNPEQHLMYMANPSVPHYLHEKAHTMQYAPGPVSDYYEKLLQQAGSSRWKDRYATPYDQRIIESEANRFASFIANLMGVGKEKGVDPKDPYLALFTEQQEQPQLRHRSRLMR